MIEFIIGVTVLIVTFVFTCFLGLIAAKIVDDDAKGNPAKLFLWGIAVICISLLLFGIGYCAYKIGQDILTFLQ